MKHYSNTFEVKGECGIQKKIAAPSLFFSYFPLMKFLTDLVGLVGTIIR